jgi:acetyltransferase-like isoleucine patch superfamily enzyme
MFTTKQKQPVDKKPILKTLHTGDQSSLRKYQEFYLEGSGLGTLLKFELLTMFVCPLPGAVGLLLRKRLYPCLFKSVGAGVLWGRNIALRNPRHVAIGDRVAVDDDCMLDARGAGNEGIDIGNDVLIARDTIIQSKASWIKIGNRCVIGSQCQLTSVGGILLGESVQVGGQCYIGGGRYKTDSREVPIMDQGLYSEGPVVIGDDVWLGAGSIVLDGVRIGKGSVVGAGAIVREDLPEYTVAVPQQRLVMIPRS